MACPRGLPVPPGVPGSPSSSDRPHRPPSGPAGALPGFAPSLFAVRPCAPRPHGPVSFALFNSAFSLACKSQKCDTPCSLTVFLHHFPKPHVVGNTHVPFFFFPDCGHLLCPHVGCPGPSSGSLGAPSSLFPQNRQEDRTSRAPPALTSCAAVTHSPGS